MSQPLTFAATSSPAPKAHEETPHGLSPSVGWYAGPALAQGISPTMANIGWWPGPNIPVWLAVCPWWIAYIGSSGSTATNTAIELGEMRLVVQQASTGRWQTLECIQTPGWIQATSENAITSYGPPVPGVSTWVRGDTLIRPSAGQCIHGGGSKVALPLLNGLPDLSALFVTLDHRLVLIDPAGVDDRASANFIVLCGADYYPTVDSTPASVLPATYLPGVGVGQFLKVQNGWRQSVFGCAVTASMPVLG